VIPNNYISNNILIPSLLPYLLTNWSPSGVMYTGIFIWSYCRQSEWTILHVSLNSGEWRSLVKVWSKSTDWVVWTQQ